MALCLLACLLCAGCPRTDMAKTKTIIWSAGGLHKGLAYQSQPPYTTPSASNVRTVGTLEGRRRGGRRPGLAVAYAQMIGAGFTPATGLHLPRIVQQIRYDGGIRTFVGGYFAYYATDADGENLAEFTETHGLTTQRTVRATTHLQKVYIANWGYVSVNGSETDGMIGTVTADDAIIAITATTMMSYYGCVPGGTIRVDNFATGATIGTYTIVSVNYTTGQIELSDGTGVASSTNIVAWFEQAPKIYDPVSNDISVWTASAGTLPDGCKLICTFLDRVVLANQRGYPHLWYMSRAGNAADWDYAGADPYDPARPMVAATGDAGQIGEPITALMPHGDSYLFFGCSHSLWVMRGDPAYGGRIDPVSRTVGVLTGDSWCSLPDGSTLFMSHEGIYRVGAGGSVPVPVSEGKIPADLKGIDPEANRVLMEYDPPSRGVHIFVVPVDEDDYTHTAYWLDLDAEAFWPVSLTSNATNDHAPYAVRRQELAGGGSRVLIAGRDGYLRYFDADAAADTSITHSAAVTVDIAGDTLTPATGTFPSWINAGDVVRLEGADYVVDERVSSTELTLTSSYAGSETEDVTASFRRETYQAIAAHIVIGPLRLGPDPFTEGIVQRIQGVLDAGSANVTYKVFTSDTAEGARDLAVADGTAVMSGTWGAGRSTPDWNRVRGLWVCIRLSGTGIWAFEEALIEIAPAGMARKL